MNLQNNTKLKALIEAPRKAFLQFRRLNFASVVIASALALYFVQTSTMHPERYEKPRFFKANKPTRHIMESEIGPLGK